MYEKFLFGLMKVGGFENMVLKVFFVLYVVFLFVRKSIGSD